MKKEDKIELEFYELPTRDIKISRFFEVAKYLTEHNLWEEVEELMTNSPIIGERIILDSILGNAVKLAIYNHTKNSLSTMDEESTPVATIKCGGRSSGGDRGGSRSGRGGGRG